MAQAQQIESNFGQLLKGWRAARGISQLGLSAEAGISSRHLSFIETGRSQPSREMVLHLAEVLEVPLRERNSLLLSAGFAPFFRETQLDAPEMEHYRHIISMLLAAHEPFGAVALDRNWHILMANDAYRRVIQALGISDEGEPVSDNILKLLFSPKGLRPHVMNWDEVGYHMIQRVHREAMEAGAGSEQSRLLQSLLRTEDIPSRWRVLDLQSRPPLMVPVHLNVGGADVRLFTTITTLGTPLDITLQELRIEALMPADRETEALFRALAETAGAVPAN